MCRRRLNVRRGEQPIVREWLSRCICDVNRRKQRAGKWGEWVRRTVALVRWLAGPRGPCWHCGFAYQVPHRQPTAGGPRGQSSRRITVTRHVRVKCLQRANGVSCPEAFPARDTRLPPPPPPPQDAILPGRGSPTVNLHTVCTPQGKHSQLQLTITPPEAHPRQ